MEQTLGKKALILLAALAALGGMFWLSDVVSREPAVTDFESCSARYPVMESYPRRCRTPQGETFTENIGNELEKDSLIRIASPRPNSAVSSPLLIKGVARGSWFFEASFPIELRDANGNILASHFATAQSEWMTEDFVPFEAILQFNAPPTRFGTLVLRKDNPSGLPEHDDALLIPVTFGFAADGAPAIPRTPCVVTGCSGHVCAEEETITTCEYAPAYACYKKPFATCERQENGQCGWTENEELAACLQNDGVLR